MLVALVDDNPEEVRAVITALTEGGEHCRLLTGGAALTAGLRRETFDLVLLDWNMPGASGLELLGWIRDNIASPPPVIMLTSRTASEDIVAALDAGASDYIIKPADPVIVRARARAAVRRLAPAAGGGIARFGLFAFDRSAGTLLIDDQPVELTRKEFEVALLLFENCNRPLARSYMLQRVWHNSPEVETRTLDVHISRLRAKLNLRPERGFSLQTVFGFGYRLESMAELGDEG